MVYPPNYFWNMVKIGPREVNPIQSVKAAMTYPATDIHIGCL